MARKRVTGRFYVFLMLVAALVLFLFRDSIFGTSEIANVLDGAASDVRSAQAVIIRDELPATETQVTRVEYVADEHTLVKKNDIVAYVYSLEYSEKKLQELNRTRKNIQEYHKVVLGKELDSQLEVYDLNVKQKALELKSLVLRTTHGNLLKLIDQLTDAMEQRRQYMSANMRSDAKLIKYYDDETQKLNSIESWRTARTADRDGVVSFYMDGYESALSVDRLEELSVADMRAVLAGESLDGSASRTVTPIYRIVDQNKWYLSVLSADGSWNPVIGTLYNFQLEGYEDLVYSGTVIRVQKTGSTVMAQLEVTDPIGPLIYQRAGNVVLGTNLSGLLVPSRAVS
ncbi:MAG: HlyD family efflux transporter periplasmic adaptor subunit, partial [Clostridia bacterium]|nr:HlyD family efflux transporter periplasmic adaptor subunit [Clostridia bacterium]